MTKSDGIESNRIIPSKRECFGVAHLMAWVALSALYLGWRRISLPPEIWKNLDVEQFVTLAIASIGAGATLASFPLLISRRWEKLAFPVHPGEWLLLALGCRTLLSLDVIAPLISVFDGPLGWRFFNLAAAATFIVFAIFCRCPRGWLLILCVAASMHFLHFVSSCLEERLFDGTTIGEVFRIIRPVILSPLDPLSQCALLLNVVLYDVRVRKSRPWTHWAGVVAFLWTGLASLSSFVLRTLF